MIYECLILARLLLYSNGLSIPASKPYLWHPGIGWIKSYHRMEFLRSWHMLSLSLRINRLPLLITGLCLKNMGFFFWFLSWGIYITQGPQILGFISGRGICLGPRYYLGSNHWLQCGFVPIGNPYVYSSHSPPVRNPISVWNPNLILRVLCLTLHVFLRKEQTREKKCFVLFCFVSKSS